MAHLLGSKNCLESLCKDVSDLQETTQSILRKVGGRVEFASWKFPGKSAMSLDIGEMLEDYSYCKDEKSNQLSHIIMFELVIDRFCLLLQAVSKLFEQAGNNEIERRPESKTVTSTMSIGLVSKIFWSKLSQFQYGYKKLEKELSDYNQSLMKMEDIYSDLKLENDKLRKKSGQKPKKNEVGDTDITEHNLSSDDAIIDSLSFSVSTQTFETAFVECEICTSLQSTLIEIGNSVVNICETQNLPSSTNKQNKILKTCKLSLSIVNKWAIEFCKDIQKVFDCVQDNAIQNKTLKSQLNEHRLKNEKYEKDLVSITTDRDTLKLRESDLSIQCTSLNELVRSYEAKQSFSDNQMTEIENENKQLDALLKTSEEELEKHKTSMRALEQGMHSMSLQLDANSKDQNRFNCIKKELEETNEKLKNRESELTISNNELMKLRSENKVLLKHDQSLQTKQASLLSRLEQLDDRCEELQTQLSEVNEENEELEEKKGKLQEKIDRKDEEIEQLKEGGKNNNESSYEQELLEKLKLIVAYPVIGENYKAVEEEYTEALSYGDNSFDDDDDVIKDMERQMCANTTRITILEQQNTSLRNSLLKLESTKDMEQRVSANQPERNDERDEQNSTAYNRHTKSAPQRLLNEELSLEPKPPSLPRSHQKVTRPRSGGRKNDNIQSRLADIERLKNESLGNTISKTQNAWSDVGVTETNNSDSFTCPDCSKSHISQRDLDIHRPFCFGRL